MNVLIVQWLTTPHILCVSLLSVDPFLCLRPFRTKMQFKSSLEVKMYCPSDVGRTNSVTGRIICTNSYKTKEQHLIKTVTYITFKFM